MKWLDLFTVSGALLGAIAFFQNAFRGIATTNKAKWAALGNDVITEEQLDNALNELRHGNVNERTQKALLHLNNKLREKGDAMKFKGLFANPYKKHLDVLFEVSETMRTRLYKPEWKKHDLPQGGGALFALNEEYFLKQYGVKSALAEKENVRKELEEDFTRALRALTAVRVLANREDIEYLLPWKWKA
ncbi:MAG TPA: hypothetical protein PK760_03450 [Flavobacteriales bacterium]|nr:hypothetical protein [Flavobacteriales bacterium]